MATRIFAIPPTKTMFESMVFFLLLLNQARGSSEVETARGSSEVETARGSSEVETVCTSSKADIVFVVDASKSVGVDNFERQLEFIKKLVEPADIDNGNVRVGLLTFSTRAHIEFHLKTYTSEQDVITAIEKVSYINARTNTTDGLTVMHSQMFIKNYGDRANVPNIAIVLTDGQSNVNSEDTIPAAVNARKLGITMYAIGIGLDNTTELAGIANKPLEYYMFNVELFESLENIRIQIYDSICNFIAKGVTTRRTLFTFHTQKASWNTANNVCKANHGRLATVNSETASRIVMGYAKSLTGLDRFGFYWIGRYYSNVYSKWTGICKNDSYWNWNPSVINHGGCGLLFSDDGNWYDGQCREEHPFVCENWKGECVFRTEEGRRGQQFVWHQNIPATTTEDCKNQCRSLKQGNRECWAVTFNNDQYSEDENSCTAYVMTDRFISLDTMLWTENHDTDLYIKVCYEGAVNHNCIPAGLQENANQPVDTCYEYEDSLHTQEEGADTPIGTQTSAKPRPVCTSCTQHRSPTSDTTDTTDTTKTNSTSILSVEQSVSTPVSQVWTLSTSADSTPPLPGGLMSSVDSAPPRHTSSVNVDVVNTSPISSSSVAEESSCCPCPNKTKLSKEESSAFISSILHDMDVVKDNVLAKRRQRRRTSIYEDRPSAKIIGYAAAAIMGAVVLGIVIVDLPNLKHDIGMMLNHIRGHPETFLMGGNTAAPPRPPATPS